MRKRVAPGLIGVYVIIAPLLYHINPVFNQEFIISISGIFIFLILAVVCLENIFTSAKRYENINVSIVDVGFASFLVYSLINMIIISQDNIDPFIRLKWITLIGLYILIRMATTSQKIILKSIVLSGVLQSSIAIAQSFGVIDNNNTLFIATGSFVNPGPLGGFICVCFLVTLCLLIEFVRQRSKTGALLLIAALIIQCVGLLLADSRAAFLGVIIGLTVALWNYYPVIVKKYRIVITTICIITAVGGGILLYNYRLDSANGRLLIWRVSADMIAEKPIFGHGVGQFGNKYLPYQADYFEKYPDSKYIMIADDVEYAFNELIHAGAEMGIVGVILLIILCIIIFRTDNSDTNKVLKAGIAGWLVFSVFSYPTDVFPLMILLIILIGFIRSKVTCPIKIRRIGYASGMALSILCIFFFVDQVCSVSKTTNALINLNTNEFKSQNIRIVDKYFNEYKNNPTFNTLFFRWYMRNNLQNADVTKLSELRPSCEGYCSAGEIFETNGFYDTAEYYYRMAFFMIPNRITPKYKLWRLYISLNNHKDAVFMAKKIIDQRVKIESTYTLRIKAQANKYLRENSPHNRLILDS